MKKRIISLVLVLVMCVGLTVPAFAEEPASEEILCADGTNLIITDDGNIRTVVSCDDTTKYTMSFDRINDTISVSSQDIQTGEVHTVTQEVERHSADSFSARMPIERSTIAKFKYRVQTGPTFEWYLERPQLSDEGTGTFYFMCWANQSNETYLNEYKTAVDNLSLYEVDLSAKQDLETVETLATLLLSGATIAAIATGISPFTSSMISMAIATANVNASARVAAEQVAIGINDCMFAIETVFYHTDNTHY